MKDLLLDETSDVCIRNFDLAFTGSDSEYVAQKIGFKLGFAEGEWFLDLSQGIPYFKRIFMKNPDLKIVGDLFKRAVLSIPEVDKIQSFLLSLTVQRELLVEFTAVLDGSESINYKETI
ncbi:MAG: hypothetical protein PQJ58_17200 [Spirochaetales bacterium]|nr:hypothetical protein [Spirochaetales bacterium]